MANLANLPALDDDGFVICVVETLKGSRTKLAYDSRRKYYQSDAEASNPPVPPGEDPGPEKKVA